jgi:hypothetical protein
MRICGVVSFDTGKHEEGAEKEDLLKFRDGGQDL